jgi:two-component system, cell cycle response regulator
MTDTNETRDIDILVVDDEEIIRKLLQDYLTHIGYNVDTVETGEEAVVSARHKRYDLVITDLLLPGMSGLDVVRNVKTISPQSCIIVVTGHGSLETAIESIRDGAYDYITKPLNMAGLELSVKRALEYNKLLSEAREKAHYKKLAQEDGLTKLYNYIHLMDLMEQELDKANRYHFPVSLLMIDIDFFKQYNDSAGHLAGNKVLVKLADIFRNFIRKTDIAARYGGEEFAILLPHTEKRFAEKLCDRLRLLVEQTSFDEEEKLPGGKLTISSGIAECPIDASSAEELIEKADQALYQAKGSGKNLVKVYSG